MRFMMLMIPKGYEAASPGTMPPAEPDGVVKVEDQLRPCDAISCVPVGAAAAVDDVVGWERLGTLLRAARDRGRLPGQVHGKGTVAQPAEALQGAHVGLVDLSSAVGR